MNGCDGVICSTGHPGGGGCCECGGAHSCDDCPVFAVDVLDADAGYDPNPFSPQGAAQDDADAAGVTWATYEPADGWRLIFEGAPFGRNVGGLYESKRTADHYGRELAEACRREGRTFAYAIVSPAGVIVSDCRSAGFAGPLPWMVPA